MKSDIWVHTKSYGLDARGFKSWQGQGIFLFTTEFSSALGPTQSATQWVTGALSLDVKRPVREVENSSPSSAEVKNTEL
jgi:hypothetical protein